MADEKPKGKFDVASRDGQDDWVGVSQGADDWQSAGDLEDQPKSLTGQDDVAGLSNTVGRMAHSASETVKHPIDTSLDFLDSSSYGNILRKPVDKTLSAIEAGGQSVADMFRPEDRRRGFNDRLKEIFNKRQAEEDAAQAKRNERSPYASSAGEKLGVLEGAAALPLKVGAAEAMVPGAASPFFKSAAGAAERIGVAGATNAGLAGLSSGEKGFDPKSANEAGLMGAGVQTAFEAAPPLVRGLGRVAKLTAGKLTQTPIEAMERYWKRPKEVMTGPTHGQLGEQLPKSVGVLRKRVTSGSEAAMETIPQSLEIPVSELEPQLEAIHQNSLKDATTESAKLAAKKMGNLKNEILGGADIIEGSGEAPGISGRKIKNVIKQLDRDIKTAKSTGEISSPQNAQKISLRSMLDEMLKKYSPEYAAAMVPVAEKAVLLEKAKPFGSKTPDSVTSRLRAITSGQPEYKAQQLAIIKQLDNELGTNYTNQAQDYTARKHFEKSQVGGGGNRWNIAGGVGLGSIGSVLGLDHDEALALGVAGVAGGALADAFLPRINKVAIDAARFAYNKLGGKQIGKFSSILEKAAKKGPVSLALVHMLLSEKNDDYVSALNEADQKDLQMEAVRQRANP